MSAAPFVIPVDRLPAGFAERVDAPPDPPAEARPAATVVLLRDAPAGGPPADTMDAAAGRSHGGSGQHVPAPLTPAAPGSAGAGGEPGSPRSPSTVLEVLLLRRHRASGFVPGAYVFPGGRVDEADADPGLLALTAALGEHPDPPASYWLAAIREVFEETGVLLAADTQGHMAPDAASEPRMARAREALLSGRAGLSELLRGECLVPALGELVCCAHWITPIAEPRRFDTRFFLARLPAGRLASVDVREMTDALWLTPAEALRRFQEGSLPMVFPTVKTLESLAGHESVDAALDAFRGAVVRPVLPRLVRTAEGVGIVIDEGEAPAGASPAGRRRKQGTGPPVPGPLRPDSSEGGRTP